MAARRSHLLVKSFLVETSAIPHGSLVKLGSTGDYVTLCTGATDQPIGVAFIQGDPLTASGAVGTAIDVVLSGIAEVKLGGTVAAGANLTSNASGGAIATTTAGNRLIGVATVAGVSGDLGCVLIDKSNY